PGVRALEPEIDDELTTAADLVGGRRTIRYLLIPDRPGTFTIPALSLPYFDPATDSYGEAASPSFTVTVTGEASAAGATPNAPDAAPAPAAAPESLGNLRPSAALHRAEPPVSARPWYRWALAAPPLLWLLILVAQASLARLRRRRGVPTTSGRLRAARARLEGAETHRKSGAAHLFYADVAG